MGKNYHLTGNATQDYMAQGNLKLTTKKIKHFKKVSKEIQKKFPNAKVIVKDSEIKVILNNEKDSKKLERLITKKLKLKPKNVI